MMHLIKVNVGLMLFGYPVNYEYLAYIKSTPSINTFIPIGREIQYQIHSDQFVTYYPIPILVYHRHHQVDVLEEDKFNALLKHFTKQMLAHKIKLYKEDGVRIEFVDQKSMIDRKNGIAILVRGRTAQQDQIRALIDISDQLFDHFPQSSVKILFYLKSNDSFYIQQVESLMHYKYDGQDHSLIFFNDTVGYFGYNIITGEIKSSLTDNLKQELRQIFHQNFPDTSSQIQIETLFIQPNLDYRSIIYN